MFVKRTVTAALASFVVMFLLAWLLFGVLFARVVENVSNPALSAALSDMPNMPLLMLSYLVLAWMMAYIFPFGYQGGSPVAEGFRFGLVIWVLVAISQMLEWMSWGALGWSALGVNGVLYLAQFVAGGIVIALVSGRSTPAVAAQVPGGSPPPAM